MEIYVFMGPGTGLRQVFGFCAIAVASAHSLPIRIIAFSQRETACEALAPDPSTLV